MHQILRSAEFAGLFLLQSVLSSAVRLSREQTPDLLHITDLGWHLARWGGGVVLYLRVPSCSSVTPLRSSHSHETILPKAGESHLPCSALFLPSFTPLSYSATADSLVFQARTIQPARSHLYNPICLNQCKASHRNALKPNLYIGWSLILHAQNPFLEISAAHTLVTMVLNKPA